MPKAGEIRYCPELGGKATNAAFVWIPPGSFWLGEKDNKTNPVHFVTLTKGFWLQQTTLTERQYNNRDSDLPQVNISWNDVIDFCKGKPLRMPTEAEWEYAARSNTGHKYLYSGSNAVNNVAWTTNNAKGKSHTVGELKANSYGLFDMSGNTREWCSDWSGTVSSTPQVNPINTASVNHRISRNGWWLLSPQNVRVAHRSDITPGSRIYFLGVRLIWEPQHA